MNHFKIHQALEHTEMARLSCSLCPKKFDKVNIHNHNHPPPPPRQLEAKVEDGDGSGTATGRRGYRKSPKLPYQAHLRMNHRTHVEKIFWNCHFCRFCGEMVPNKKNNPRGKPSLDVGTDKLHVISRHPKLINVIYTCTSCSWLCSDLKEFLQHSSSSHQIHVNANANAITLCDLRVNQIECKLCPEATETLSSYLAFMAHLTVKYILYLKWDFDPSTSTLSKVLEPWSSIESHVKIMMRHHVKGTLQALVPKKSAKRKKTEIIKTKKTPNNNNLAAYKRKHPANYTCPSCPKLGKMNIDEFIAHVIFHWRRPNKCTKCRLYLPISEGIIDNHWKQLHGDVYSSISTTTTTKFETVKYTPGKVFECGECPQTFESIQFRNEHLKMAHNQCSEMSLRCNLCDDGVRNTEEMRLHKAIIHPEAASVSCYYCDEVFNLESAEGVPYRDCEALNEHIMDKGDHPHTDSSKRVHLDTCPYCGKAILDGYKMSQIVQTHIVKDHGIKKSLSFSCPICSLEMCTSVHSHLSKCHAQSVICDTCGEAVSPRWLPEHCLTKHNILTEGRTVLTCTEEGCGYKTYWGYYLTTHTRRKHNPKREKIYPCSICGKKFFDDGHRKEHEKIHTNKETKPYQCEICGASFALRNYLYIHRRLSHLGKKFPSTNRKRPRKDTSSKCNIPPTSTSTTLEDL